MTNIQKWWDSRPPKWKSIVFEDILACIVLIFAIIPTIFIFLFVNLKRIIGGRR